MNRRHRSCRQPQRHRRNCRLSPLPAFRARLRTRRSRGTRKCDEIFRLRELRQKTTVDTAARDEQIKRINDLQDYIAQQTTYLTEFDESLVRRWIKQITIWDDHITVELKSGVSTDVDA